MIKIEWNKIRRNLLPYIVLCLMPVLINILLVLDLHFRYSYLLNQKDELGFTYWQLIFKEQNIFMINQLIPLFASMLVFMLFHVETKYNAWTNVRLYNLRIDGIVKGKFVFALIFIIILTLLSCITIIPVGRITGVTTPVEWKLMVIVFITLVMGALSAAAVAFLIISLTSKMVNMVTISCFIFLFSAILQNVNQDVMTVLNPYSFATLCYTQNWKDVLIHLLMTTVWIVVCFVVGTRRLEQRKELE